MRFKDPLWLFLIFPILALIYFYIRGILGREAALKYSSVDLLRDAGAKPIVGRRILQGFLRGAILVLLILCLARPQTGTGQEQTTQNAVDIMIALDVSGSMATLDFHPDNRLAAAKIEARRFIEGRPHDRIGLVIFGGQSFTQCPLTVDHQAILTLLSKIQLGMVADGTAIGLGLGNAVNRLKDSEAKSKVIILLTDGVNNSGEIDPLTAANLAKELGLRVYTVGVGKEGTAYIPVQDPRFGTRLIQVDTQIDEKVLTQIAQMTGGQYFRAQDEKGLRGIFKQIDSLEKTKVTVETSTHYEEQYFWFLWPALLILWVEVILFQMIAIKLP